MNIKELDAKINDLIVKFVPYLLENNPDRKEITNVIQSYLKLQKLDDGKMRDIFDKKRQIAVYLSKKFDDVESKKTSNVSMPVDAEEVFTDLMPKTNTI